MTLFVLAPGGTVAQYPYSLSKLRRDNPDVSFPLNPSPALLADHGVFPVAPVDRPANTVSTNFVEAPPVLSGGLWSQAWAEVPASAEEVAIRTAATRNEAEKQTIRADNFVGNFIAMTPAEVSAYVNGNVSNLQQAKALLEKMAIMLLLLARREFR